MRKVGLLMVAVLAIAACAITQPVGDDATRRKAEAAGRIAGRKCTLVLIEAPNAGPAIQQALDAARSAMASPDFTLAALDQVMNQLPNDRARLVGSVLVGDLIDGLVLRGIDVGTVAPDSPLLVGLGAAVKTCQAALLVPV